MKLVRPEEVAAMLGVTTETVRKLFLSGQLKGFTLPSGHRRYAKEDVEKLIEKQHLKKGKHERDRESN